MDQNTLFETLGIFIGFSGIMLTLSLLVTSLTQAFVYFFNIRARNLRVGLGRLLELAPEVESGRDLADEILNANSVMKGKKAGGTSWILEKELKMLLSEHEEFDNISMDKILPWFERMEKGLQQSFRAKTRWISLICALFVALIFQVSAPDTLQRLSTDPEYRIQAVKSAEELVNKYETDYQELMRYEDISSQALERLQQNHPDLQETLEEVSGVGDARQDILDELSLVLEDHPERESMVLEYEMILEELHRKGYEQAVEWAQMAADELASFDITPWTKGFAYYGDISNILGVLMTAVLIGLGAPFWFNTLKGLMSFRDALQPEKKKAVPEKDEETTPSAPRKPRSSSKKTRKKT